MKPNTPPLPCISAQPADLHGGQPPSAWIQRWSHLLKPASRVLDLACGRGRHARWFHGQGHTVTALDRCSAALALIDLPPARCEKVLADIESGAWPLAGRQFDAVVVSHYLWRPLMPVLLDSLAPGGVLIYETFTQGNETVGKPSRPDFLLQAGELLRLCTRLQLSRLKMGLSQRACTEPRQPAPVLRSVSQRSTKLMLQRPHGTF